VVPLPALNNTSCGEQGCQMKISIKSQTMLKTGQERLSRLFKGQKKSQTLFAVLAFFCHKKYLNYKNIKKKFLQN